MWLRISTWILRSDFPFFGKRTCLVGPVARASQRYQMFFFHRPWNSSSSGRCSRKIGCTRAAKFMLGFVVRARLLLFSRYHWLSLVGCCFLVFGDLSKRCITPSLTLKLRRRYLELQIYDLNPLQIKTQPPTTHLQPWSKDLPPTHPRAQP